MNKKEKEQTNRLLLACQITKFTMIELSLPKMQNLWKLSDYKRIIREKHAKIKFCKKRFQQNVQKQYRAKKNILKKPENP